VSVHKRMTDKGARYDVRYRDPDGVQRKQTFHKKADADRFENSNNAAMDQGTYSDPSLGRTTFKQVAEGWLAGHRNRSTRQAVELRLRLHVYPVLGHKQVSKIKPSDMDDLARAVEHLSDSYQRVILTNASSVLGRAVRDRLIAENPAKSLKRPKVTDKPLVVWTPEQVHAVYEALPDRYALLVLLGSGLGLRQGEAFGLSPDDIDFLGGHVHVRRQVKLFGDGSMAFAQPKGQKERKVPLPASVRDAVAAYMTRYPSKAVTLPWDGTRVGHGLPKQGEPVTARLLLTSRESAALNRNYVNSRVWKPALVAAGIEPTRENGCHALRHWYATTLVTSGTPMKTVSDYLGHADVAFTMRVYTHRTDGHDNEARKAVDAALTLPDAPCATDAPSGTR
jgi:integrase